MTDSGLFAEQLDPSSSPARFEPTGLALYEARRRCRTPLRCVLDLRVAQAADRRGVRHEARCIRRRHLPPARSVLSRSVRAFASNH
jgi:hypothetical protein